MDKIKVGMYVRVSVDYEDEKNPRMFAMGQVEEVNEYSYLVVFHKNYRQRDEDIIHHYIPSEKEYSYEDINRVKILKGSKVIYGFDTGVIMNYSHKCEEGYMYYIVKLNTGEIKTLKESEVMVDFNRADVDPIRQMKTYEFHNPFWYKKRQIASEAIHMMNNFGEGFKTLISSRAYLFQHQIDTIVRALNEKECRLMLADEVGLGKTIEALVILKGLKKKKERVIIIVPEALVNQWKNELGLKFWMESIIYNGRNIDSGEIVIISLEKVKTISLTEIKDKFDYCVIDEVHRAVKNEIVYEKLLNISKIVKKILLLSATPIQNRKEEYLRLLTLLKPQMYEKMTEVEFSKLYDKNKNIKRIVHKICRDLPDIYGDEVDLDGVEEIFERLEMIAEELNDKCLKKLVDELDEDDEDYSEGKVREILAYISINYQFEKNIIRHRREELKDILPKRTLETIYYEMKSSSDNYYESNCYEELIKYIESIKFNNSWTYEVSEYIRILLNAMFSSPWAFKEVLKIRKEVLDNRISKEEINLQEIINYREYRKRIKSIVSKIDTYKNEKNELLDIEMNLDKWVKSAQWEVENVSELMDDPDKIKGRMLKVFDYIEQELFDKKVVIFTGWNETLLKMKELLINAYGEKVVSTFSINDNISKLESNVSKFQNDNECRIMLCDELGGEGRNFQMAEAIIHLDIPFSPTVLEQRIGRLDRIGRNKEKDVLNVVITAEDTIEMSLFELWNEGLNIFNESLSGLEIALEDINNDILNALEKDMKYGLSDAIENIKENLKIMKKSIAEERYYDMARQLDYNTKKRYDKIINHFDNEGGELLAAMMLSWANAVGFKPISCNNGVIEFGAGSVTDICMQHTMFSLPDTSKSLKKSKKENVIRGTFDRSIAVNKEDLVFFAPGEEIFESIMTNVEEGFRGRCNAIRVQNTPYEWEGFIFRWNSSFNLRELIDKNININYSNFSYGNMPIEQYTSIFTIKGDVDVNDIKNFIKGGMINNEDKRCNSIHLGKRSGLVSSLNEFKKQYPSNVWNNIVNEAYRLSREEFSKKYVKMVDINKMKREFSNIYAGAMASEKYFNSGEDNSKLKEALQAVMKGIVNPEISLDSIMYIKMEK